ncbi:hypothetical protein BC834DRAFT_970425 [Gloeopeniophorella convolvens]|nr:hypothetical protein BC834DRAFT_970425 [Gloeopeniophorella convolvens]
MPAIEPSSAEQYRSLFTEALVNFKKKTGQDPAAHPLVTQLSRCTPSEETTALLQEEAERLDATHKTRWRTRICEKITPIVEIIRPLCDTAGKATGLAFKPGEAIFGSIGILLAIPDNYMKNHEAFMGLLEKMADFLGRLKILIVPEDDSFDDGMTKILVDILVKLIRAFALLTERTSPSDAFILMAKCRFRKVLATVSGDKEVGGILKRLDELTKVEHLMATAEVRRDIAIVRREQRRQERMQQAERYRSWLSVPNSSTNQVTASETRYSDTSMWLVHGDVYGEWKSSGALLWVTGKPGAGKTVICSTVIKDLQDLLHSSTSSGALAYFYCDFRDTDKQSYRGLLSSLLVDLSTQLNESDNLLRNLYSKCKNGSRKPDADDLIRCLEEMLVRSDGIKYIVVDALDEMPNYGVSSSRAKTLELVSKLVGLGRSDLRICITSRPEGDIGQVLRPLTCRQVVTDQEKGHRDDIARLIRSVVESNRKMQVWGEAIKEEVIQVLSEKADGMFRYVTCQLDTLCECPLSKIRPTLKSLPTTLHATYEATLERISEEKWDYAHRLFQFLSFSRRPLYVEDLAEALAVSLDEEIPTYHDDWLSDDPESVVLSTCPGNFIQVTCDDGNDDSRNDDPRYFPPPPLPWPVLSDRDRRVVQFTHFSVKEFLTSDQLSRSKANVSRFRVLPRPSHAILAKTCLGILLRPNDAPAVEQSFPDERYLYPNNYAVTFWDEHARFEDVSASLLKTMALLLDPTKPHFASYSRSREPHQHVPQASLLPGTPLYFATLSGLPSIVEHILASGSHDINARGGEHDTALHAAVNVCSLTVIRLLLDRDADINAQGGRHGNALRAAVSKGKLDIIELLLDHGADTNLSQSDHRWSALQMAAEDGKLDVVRLLLDRSADINYSQGSVYGGALQSAAWRGKLDMVRLLLDYGADINNQGGKYGSALQMAVGSCEADLVEGVVINSSQMEGKLRDVVRLLLGRGADINNQGGNYGGALQIAAWTGKLDMVRLLLDYNADINSQGGEYGSALQVAAWKGKLDMVRLLLDRGADINNQGGNHGGALQIAAWTGELDMVRLLLDRGADVNSQGGEYGSALQVAVGSGKLDVVQLLLDGGADINSQGGGGWFESALQKAANYKQITRECVQAAACNLKGKTDVVQFFLDRGLDINAQGGEYGTALIGASHSGNVRIVRLLLTCGADTSIESEKYGTALEAAQTSDSYRMNDQKRVAIVELLSSVPQDASVVQPNEGAGSST